MSDRRHAQWKGIDPRRQTARGGLRWLVIPAVRPWVLPMFEPRGAIRDNESQTGRAPAMSRRTG